MTSCSRFLARFSSARWPPSPLGRRADFPFHRRRGARAGPRVPSLASRSILVGAVPPSWVPRRLTLPSPTRARTRHRIVASRLARFSSEWCLPPRLGRRADYLFRRRRGAHASANPQPASRSILVGAASSPPAVSVGDAVRARVTELPRLASRSSLVGAVASVPSGSPRRLSFRRRCGAHTRHPTS
jgi:hypothetical protein